METTSGTVRILGLIKATIDAEEVDVGKPIPIGNRPLEPDKEALSRSSISASKKGLGPPMAHVPVLVRCKLPGLVQMKPKYAVFVNHRLRLTNVINEIDQERPFTVVVANFSNVSRKIPKHVVLGFPTRSPKLLIPVYSPLVAHISEYLGYVAQSALAVVDESPLSTCPVKPPPDPEPSTLCTKFLNTPEASVHGPIVSPKYDRLDGKSKAAEPPKDWRDMIYLSNIDDEAYRKQVLAMLERHKKMCSSHLCEIKGVSHSIELRSGTSPILQQQYRAGAQRRVLVEEPVNEMLAADVIETAQSD